MRAVIEIEGGIIANIMSDEPLEVMVIDRDQSDAVDGDDRLVEINREEVVIRVHEAEEDGLEVESLFNMATVPCADEEEEH